MRRGSSSATGPAARRASLRQAAAVRAHLAAAADRASQRLVRPLDRVAPLVERVVDQAHRRVIGGQTVPAHEKVLSLFAPRTAVIRRGKAGHATEFGRKVRLDETDGGILSRDAVLEGNPPDADRLAPGLAHHRRLVGRPTWSPPTGASTPPPTSRPPTTPASGAWPCPNRAAPRRSGAATSASAGSAARCASAPGPKAASASASAVDTSAAAVTGATTPPSAGSAGASSPP